MLTVAGAAVLYVDSARLLADLGCRPDDFASVGGLERWLLNHIPRISRIQAAQSAANTPVRASGPEIAVYRPRRYVRAAILHVPHPRGDFVLFDVKGCGVRPGYRIVPDGANGLMSLSEAVHELLMERLTAIALRHARHAVATVPIYAILDLGFDVRPRPRRPAEPAVLLVRAARPRPEYQWGDASPEPGVAARLLDIELTLRRYGITASSSGAVRFHLSRRGKEITISRDGSVLPLTLRQLAEVSRHAGFCREDLCIDGVNIQVALDAYPTTRALSLIDFGCYRLQETFANAVFSPFDRNVESLRGLFIGRGSPRFVIPSPDVSLAHFDADHRWLEARKAMLSYDRSASGAARLRETLAALGSLR